MADCKRMAVVDSSGEDSPSKRRRILATPETMLRRRRHNQLGDSRGFKLLRRSTSSCSADVEHSLHSSCCSCNELHDVVFITSPLLDLEAKSFETDYYTAPPSHKFRETTPSSELCLENSEEMDSPAVSKSPPSDEIEEFFATAEKYEQKRFAEKYNFDIVKEAPLEGRYHWVRLKP
ncbi:PREDICTED: cyclin-dependent kinase inhibitor 7 isoform X2 [Fragaria vesca subsp. vesca]|uniref:cyclin-dependent kinase inhibitor 7 isoform X2 n=1 Tax=Fragaria vesca subsp. vesca TaxID=101020 RepID=UPI0002C3525F|nr:PREDICTED: cyclin-dependent kinase inhibitor 7 isoform X2 [Fragaria vesca subsp. vesca]